MVDKPTYVNEAGLSVFREKDPDDVNPNGHVSELQLDFMYRYVCSSVQLSSRNGVPTVVNAPTMDICASVLFRTSMAYSLIKMLRNSLGKEDFDQFVTELMENEAENA